MKVIVGISGGVDSSVSALCLKKQGYEVEALFMKNWHEETETGECSWEADVEDALQVCDKLDIALNTVDLSATYWNSVFSSILEDFRNGLTPNPDILCNQEIKFKAFHDHAIALGADNIATGHYARIQYEENCNRLLKSSDLNKDQSYFLCRLNQQQLSRSLFPIGEMDKSEVRKIARNNNFKTHDKKDSTGICFIGERPFKEFLSQYIPVNKGPIQTLDGNILGEHDGVYFYTIGQRQGLGIGGIRGNSGDPWYVVDKDKDENILYVAQGQDNALLFSKGVNSVNLHWIGNAPSQFPYLCAAKTRYRQADQSCVIESVDCDTARIVFKEANRAVTPGQYIVFYDGDICLGGGVIASTFR
jgi:tRNA-specific 2-thiouridylase